MKNIDLPLRKKRVMENDKDKELFILTSTQSKCESSNEIIIDGTFNVPYTAEDEFIVDDNLNNESEKKQINGR